MVVPFGTIPLLIEGVVDQWEAFRKWKPEYLVVKYGGEIVRCFVVNKQERIFLQQVNQSETLSFAAFLSHISNANADDTSLKYLRIDTRHPLFQSLSADFDIPTFLENYNQDATGIWMGQKGNLTPFHHDWWHSCLAQVAGRKRFLLVHPFEMVHLMQNWDVGAKYDLSPAPYFPPNDERLKSILTYYEGVLEPGQLLYIPPFWYHQIETLDNANISIPIRYDTCQTLDVPLFKLSQDSGLRHLTNQKISDKTQLVKYLADNRQRFFQKETAFAEALVKARNLESSATEILQLVENEKND